MKKEEKRIWEAAEKYRDSGATGVELAFIVGAKSDAAKEYHTKGMYSEKQIHELLMNCVYEGGVDMDEVEKWFKKNK